MPSITKTRAGPSGDELPVEAHAERAERAGLTEQQALNELRMPRVRRFAVRALIAVVVADSK